MNTNEEKGKSPANAWTKNILQAMLVAAVGFVLLNITFLLYFLVFQLFDVFAPGNTGPMPAWIPVTRAVVFLAIIALISWFVFRSKLPVIFKATFVTVPTAVVLAFIGIIFFSWPLITYLTGAVLVASVLVYFYRTRQPWLYYYSVILVAVTMAIFTLTGGEI